MIIWVKFIDDIEMVLTGSSGLPGFDSIGGMTVNGPVKLS